MDFLFVELMLWGRAQGYRWFNLGMAPLAGLEQHRLAPMWHKAGRLVFRYGEEFYNFAGLRQYKDKFLPEWRPRYLAAPGRLALPRVLLDVTALISGRADRRAQAATADEPAGAYRKAGSTHEGARACLLAHGCGAGQPARDRRRDDRVPGPRSGVDRVTGRQAAVFRRFLSGDGGWNKGVVDMARHLAEEGALVAGVDIRKIAQPPAGDAGPVHQRCGEPRGTVASCRAGP